MIGRLSASVIFAQLHAAWRFVKIPKAALAISLVSPTSQQGGKNAEAQRSDAASLSPSSTTSPHAARARCAGMLGKSVGVRAAHESNLRPVYVDLVLVIRTVIMLYAPKRAQHPLWRPCAPRCLRVSRVEAWGRYMYVGSGGIVGPARRWAPGAVLLPCGGGSVVAW